MAFALGVLLAGCDVVAEEEPTPTDAELPEGVEPPEVDVPEPPCNEGTAQRAVMGTDFAGAVTAHGKLEAALDGRVETDFRAVRFRGPERFRVALVECGDLTGDGIGEMVVGIARDSKHATDWAVFTPESAADWQLVLPMDGAPLRAARITEDGLELEIPTTRGGGSGSGGSTSTKSNHLSFDPEAERFRLATPQAGRLLRLSDGTPVRLDGLQLETANPREARERFGQPTSRRRDGNLCAIQWGTLGLTVNFVELGGGDRCGGDGRIGSLDLIGGPAALAGWRTEENLSVGDRERKARRAYPDAEPDDRGLALVRISSPAVADGRQTTLSAIPVSGRILALRAFVGAGGE